MPANLKSLGDAQTFPLTKLAAGGGPRSQDRTAFFTDHGSKVDMLLDMACLLSVIERLAISRPGMPLLRTARSTEVGFSRLATGKRSLPRTPPVTTQVADFVFACDSCTKRIATARINGKTGSSRDGKPVCRRNGKVVTYGTRRKLGAFSIHP